MLRRLFMLCCLLGAASAATLAHADVIRIQSNQQTVAEITTTPDISIRYWRNNDANPIQLHTTCKGDKCKYTNQEGQLVAEIKYYQDKLKLRTVEPSTEIKYKGTAEKHKIVVNGDEDHPVTIKPKSGKLKVYRVLGTNSETELGQIQLNEAASALKIKSPDKDDLYRITDTTLRPVYGALLDSRLQPVQRYILIAEAIAHPLP